MFLFKLVPENWGVKHYKKVTNPPKCQADKSELKFEVPKARLAFRLFLKWQYALILGILGTSNFRHLLLITPFQQNIRRTGEALRGWNFKTQGIGNAVQDVK